MSKLAEWDASELRNHYTTPHNANANVFLIANLYTFYVPFGSLYVQVYIYTNCSETFLCSSHLMYEGWPQLPGTVVLQ